MKSSSPEQQYRADVDGLRTIAVFSAAFFHAGIPGFGGGFVGVDVFYVISGYLILGMLIDELEATGSINLGDFFSRRLRRLLPALLLVISATLVASILFLLPDEILWIARSARAAFLFVSNHYFLTNTGGYFDQATELMPLLHTWSLSVEGQYYLVWPFFLLALTPAIKGRNRSQTDKIFFASLAVISITSFVACGLVTRSYQAMAFYLMPMRAWEFALGGLFFLAGRNLTLSGRQSNVAGMIGFLMIGVAVASFRESHRFPGWIAMIPAFGAGLVMLAHSSDAGRATFLARWIGCDWMARLGRWSYSFYLWHWPILSLTRSYNLGWHHVLLDAALLLPALLLAALTYRYVETPVRKSARWHFGNFRSLLTGLAVTLLAVQVTQMVIERGEDLNRYMAIKLGVEKAVKNPFANDTILQALQKCGENFLEDTPIPAPGEICAIGRKAGPYDLMFWGDSHALVSASMLSLHEANSGKGGLIRSHGSCPPLLDVVPYDDRRGASLKCGQYNENVFSEVQSLAATGLHGVVLFARWSHCLGLEIGSPTDKDVCALADGWHQYEADPTPSGRVVGKSPLDPQGALRSFEKGLRKLVGGLHALGLRVLIVAPYPELTFRASACLQRRSADECTTPREKIDKVRKPALDVIRKVARDIPDVRVFEPIDSFCDDRRCTVVRGNDLLYIDDNHISDKMAALLYETAKDPLEWAAALPASPLASAASAPVSFQ